jgi:hypothetical protein
MSILEESQFHIPVAPTMWYWYPKLNEEYGHEGHCKSRHDPHKWIVVVISFLVICGTPRSSSWLGSYGLVKLEAPKYG